MNHHLTSAVNGAVAMRTNGHRTAQDQERLDFIMRSLDSIRNEIALGTEVDPKLVREIEARLAIFETQSLHGE